jgi:hypothetical protein
MKDRTVIGTPNQRRANRISWERPIRIISPFPVAGETVNISACGLLVHLSERRNLRRGARVAVEIPRTDGMAAASILRQGHVVRIEPTDGGVQVAIDLA